MTTAHRLQHDVNFNDPVINRNPWPYLDQIRDMAPAVFNPPSNSWYVTSYDNVRAVLGNDADFAPVADLMAEMFGDPIMLGSDNPRLREVRGIWGPHLLRSAVKMWTGVVEEIAERQLAPVFERLRDGEVVDIVPPLWTIPATIIANMIGVPSEDCGKFSEWGQRIAAMYDAYTGPGEKGADEIRKSGVAATEALHEYCGEQLDKRRRSSNVDDLLGVLANTSIPMTEREQRTYITIFIEGAQDTSAKFVTTALAALAQHPEQRKAIVDD